MRIMLYPGSVGQTVYSLAQYPGLAMTFGAMMLVESWAETHSLTQELNALLGTTKAGKTLHKKWRRLLADTNFFLLMG